MQLLQMLKLERYVKAFTVFDDVIRDNLDILAVSGFFALVAWIFASSLLYVCLKLLTIMSVPIFVGMYA